MRTGRNARTPRGASCASLDHWDMRTGRNKFNKLQEDFTETVKKLNNTPGGASRPEATGGSGAVMADC